jgi:hypothetical protein
VEPSKPTVPPERAGGASRSRAQRARLGVLGTFGWLAIFGIGAAAGAILGEFDVAGWIIGLVVSALTVALGYLLRRELGD